MTAVPKIYQAIAAIQSGVGNIPKNGIGPASQGSYKYVKNDDILEAISKQMVANNVITKPEITGYELVTREIGAGRVVPMTIVHVRMTYISVEDGSEFTVSVSAEGADNGDKAGRKAITQAQKIANLLTFNIATGEPDPDGMEVTPVAQQATPRAMAQAQKGAAEHEKVFGEIKQFLGANGLSGSVANKLGERFSEGKPASEWSTDVAVLKQILKALKAGEVE
jgi:hypothetical protein